MKKFFTLLMLVSFSVIAFGQTPKVEDRVATLEGQVKTLEGEMTAVQTRLAELADRNAEYKKALDLKQILSATDSEGFQYGFLSAVGNRKEGTIVITFNILNTGESRKRQFERAQLVDFEGNPYELWGGYTYGNAGPYTFLETNVNMKLSFTFKDITTETKRIARLTLITQNDYGKVMGKVAFSDLPVEWK